MAQFGQANPTDEEVQRIVARVLSNQDEVKKLSDQLGWKLLELFKEKQNQQQKKLLTTNLLLRLTENKVLS
jgi:trigger factor